MAASSPVHARDALRAVPANGIDRIWPSERAHPSEVGAPSTGAESFIVKIQTLSRKDDQQRSIQAQALSTVTGLSETRWLMYEQEANSVSNPMQVSGAVFLICIRPLGD
jgi:hypothetical protein